jgi:hypothetical protein
MMRNKFFGCTLLFVLGVCLATSGHAQPPQHAPQAAKPARASKKAAAPAVEHRARAQGDRAPEGRQRPPDGGPRHAAQDALPRSEGREGR